VSQENVEIVRAAYDTWNTPDMEAFRDLYTGDAIIVRGLDGWPEPGPFVGRDAIVRAFVQLRETWDSDTLEPISFIDLGDRVLARHIWHGVGHGPGLSMEQTVLFTLREGKVFLLEYFWVYAEALEAVGLSEQAMSQENVQIARETWRPLTDARSMPSLHLFTLTSNGMTPMGFRDFKASIAGGRACGAGWKRSWKPGKASMAKSNRRQRGAMAESSFRWLEPHAEGPVAWRPSFARGSSSG
jgi:ketosteroid isomerase-like protein